MRFLFYFRLSSYLLVGSGFLALLVTDDYGIFSAIIFAAILLIGWNVDAGKLQFSISPFTWNLATILFLFFCIADVMFLRKMTSVGLVNFLVFLQATKLFTPKHDRDFIAIYIISFFELLISSIMTLSILFALSCIISAVTGTWALITLNLKRDIETHLLRKAGHSTAAPQTEDADFNVPTINTLLNVKFFTGTFGITLLTFIISLVVFAILPRVKQGYFFRYGGLLSQNVSGFSEEVALDNFGTIRLDHRPVMRVVLPKVTDTSQLPSRLYWKGVSFNHYDGTRWRSDAFMRKHIPITSRQQQQSVRFARPPEKEHILEQRYELMSSGYEVLFAANPVYNVRGRFLSLQYDKISGNIHAILNPYSPNYTVYSDITPLNAEEVKNDYNSYPSEISAAYLQLPELSKRIQDLAYQISNGSDDSYDTALAIQSYLRQNYQYSLSVQRSPDLSPLEDFLFVNTAGHCEYYATSMTILLRILGIPARVVNGFAQGRWNEYGNFFTVRQSDAHAWVEVFFPSYGWATFDPTPPIAFGDTYQQFAEQPHLLASLYRYTEYLRTKWNRYIVDYSTDDQVNMLIGAFHATRSARRNASYYKRRIKAYLRNIVTQWSPRKLGILAGIGLAAFFLIRFLNRKIFHFRIRLPRWNKRSAPANKRVVRFYDIMLRTLARKGIARHPTHTPGEFAQSVARKYPLYGSDVQHITNLYYAVRYGQYHLHDGDIQKIETALADLKKKHS